MSELLIGAEMLMNKKKLLSHSQKKVVKDKKVKKETTDFADDIKDNIKDDIKDNIKDDIKDDNEEILELLQSRLALGRERYGHGVIVDQNTKDFGTEEDDWELMALEEMLDGLIYTTASIIRLRRRKELEKEKL